MESSALRLITGLGNIEVMPGLTRFFSTESKQNIISSESEELNRVVVLTIARAIHVTGNYYILVILVPNDQCSLGAVYFAIH